MITIKEIEISKFRSIRDTKLVNLAGFSVLAGLNNSGKSNILRALNLFFTDKPEPFVNFDILKDFYRGDLASKKRKIISVSVHFTLSSSFKFRHDLKPVEAFLNRDFKLRKEWKYRQNEPLIYLNDSTTPLLPDAVEKVKQFLSLITFRYIPNRVIPTELIRQEQQALRDVLVRRLAKKRSTTELLFKQLHNTADSLVANVSNDVTKFAPHIDKVRLSTAESLADLAFKFGYRLSEAGVEMDEDEQGSGMQSLLMFETLHLIDKDYFQQFGWKQAAIWAVEEPESSLNTSLEVQTSYLLSRIANEKNNRLQIIATTHSDLMIQYSNQAYFVEKKATVSKGLTTIVTNNSVPEILKMSSESGVSRWVNPLLLNPLTPMLIVEGITDKVFIKECLKLMKQENIINIVCLADIKKDDDQGGVDSLLRFAKENVDVIKNRKTKIVVLLDWDVASKVNSFQKLFSSRDPFICLAWKVAYANPKLTSNFRGIERFFPNRIVEYVEKNSTLIFRNSNGDATFNKDESDKVKKKLNAVVSHGLNTGDEFYAKRMIEECINSMIEL